ncbi:hypothetical protein LCGC14_1209620 [marine sediment metagenome]|uniref:Phage recombination protein Bet n=1 Tax=marine sediment metagenome TaxID=412755 RepID=A0A0F9NWT5_9ZZZZ
MNKNKPSEAGQAQSTTLPAVVGGTMKKGLSAALADKYGLDEGRFLDTVKATCFPDGGKKVSNEQLAAFLIVANEYGLNPFIRQIYAFTKDEGITPIVPIDGWAKIVNEHPQFDGLEFIDVTKDGKIVSITCIIYRKDRKHAIGVPEYLAECMRNTSPWNQWPFRMLRHKAFIQAARLAFGLSGIVDPDEANRIEGAEIVDAEVLPDSAIDELFGGSDETTGPSSAFDEAVAWLSQKHGVDEAAILKALKRENSAQVTEVDLATLSKMAQEIKDGEKTVEEVFGKQVQQPETKETPAASDEGKQADESPESKGVGY